MKFITLALALTLSFQSFASSAEDFVSSTQDDIILVLSCGLGGAVLGLSTLSFVDEPKDNTDNILVGASVGIIAGVIIAAYNAAGKSRDMFDDKSAKVKDSKFFATTDRKNWHLAHNKFYQDKMTPDQVRFNFTF